MLSLDLSKLDVELLGLLAEKGAMTAKELAQQAEGVFLSEQGIALWLDSARRRVLVESDENRAEEWRVTDRGRKRLDSLQAQRALIPRSVIDRVIATAVDGLLLALKTVVAGVPAVLLAWAVGIIQNPNTEGLLVLGSLYALIAGGGVLRWRAVRRARAEPLMAQVRALDDMRHDVQMLSAQAFAAAAKMEAFLQERSAVGERALEDADFDKSDPQPPHS